MTSQVLPLVAKAHRLGLRLSILLTLLATGIAWSQELVPRQWNHLPIDKNFVGAGYAFTWANIAFDPVLKLDDVELEMHTFALSYLRTFKLLNQSARVELKLPFQDGRWSGLLDGAPASTRRSGVADPVVRLAMNVLGGPPLKGEAFATYRATSHHETIVGIGLAVQVPLGQYDSDKLLNLGHNRFTIRPQVGIVRQRGDWTAELTGSIWFFTPNTSFFNGQRLEQKPLFAVQSHVLYTFRPGFWGSLSGGFGYGGESIVDHEAKDNEQRNVIWALGLGYAPTRQFGLRLAYVRRRDLADTGVDSDMALMGLSYVW